MVGHLLFEAFAVGVVLSIIGLIISYIIMYCVSPRKTKHFRYWWYIVLSFFLSGFLGHLIFEATGVNKMYCKHSVACKNSNEYY